ncbi:muts domain V-domain-containing protein [Fusarium redolens]|uniref:Muts domain V-domain-containing protein n=1 Tax=Fusarium redolens TaxID=48865 RepID=A0A9P9KRN5_FUSRE|nr:muts domain V-domain-containing protein [Fusarium redolens]KAH7267274.1 muts domain V-domain-containing protein [Fusarium redolens]
MVPPVFGIRHLRPLASASASASRPISAAASVVSDAVIVGSPSPKASSISHGYRHIDHPLHHGFSIRPFRHPPSPHRPLQTRGKKTTTTIKLSDLPQGLIQPKPVSLPPTSSSVSSPHDESTEALPLPLPPLPQDPPAYPTVLLQARQNMLKFDNCVLLTRVGGFYELYFEHAEEFGPLLNIKVANKKTNAGLVPMAGFPFFQLDRFLKILVQDLGRHVAIAEEYPNSPTAKVRSGGLMHDRRVARIITPGTLIDENFMDPYANNYVMAIHMDLGTEAPNTVADAKTVIGRVAGSEGGLAGHEPESAHPAPSAVGVGRDAGQSQGFQDAMPLGLAWLDLSTGHFCTQEANLASLPTILSRLCPRELLLDQALQSCPDSGLSDLLAEDRHIISYVPRPHDSSLFHPENWAPMLESALAKHEASAFSSAEVHAAGFLLGYVKDRLQGMSMKLQPPLRNKDMQVMAVDKNSMRALEIKQTIRDGVFRGSLLHAIRRTVTKSGARLLNEWLSAPSTSLELITSRQDLVARFIDDVNLSDSVILLLRRSHDSQRLVQKFTLGRGDADDLLDLASTIDATKNIVNLLKKANAPSRKSEHHCLTSLISRISLTQPLKLAQRIRDAIDEEGIELQHEVQDSEASQMLALAENVVSNEGSQDDAASLPKGKRKRPGSIRDHYAEDNGAWIMRPAASPTLTKLHIDLATLIEEKATLNETLRESLNAPSLSLKWTPGLGHIAHIKGKDARNLADVQALSSSRSTRSFHISEWTLLGQRIDQVRAQIRAEEQAVFYSLREHVVKNLVKLRRNAAVLDELDITTSFAKLAREQNLVRPMLNNTTSHTIIGGRHPTVEGGLFEQGRSFVRNDCLVGSPTDGRIWLITGPNMAGKSTFLRQNALITILAQIGCYVPASYAELGIVDAIFSRVGSADNLYRDQSTFMVEMLETAAILKQATPRSFVIMDEIGRGTTPEDGTAVAFACLHHLATVNQCRTLFATHFHSVADLAQAEGLCSAEAGVVVQTYCTNVVEDGEGGFFYNHKLQRGINRQSHALKVARLAGLPDRAIEVAKRALKQDNFI